MITMKLGILMLAISATANNLIYSVGDTIELSAGYSNFLGMSGGSNEDVVIVDSIRMNADTTFYRFKVMSSRVSGFFENGNQRMAFLFSEGPLRLATLESAPSSVQTNSTALKKCRWIIPEYSSLIFYPSIHPIAKYCPIPILNSSLLNKGGIRYKVRVTDSCGMLWENPKEAYEFTGKRLQYLSQNDTVGTQVSDSSPGQLSVTPKWSYPYLTNEITPLVFAVISVSTNNPPLIDTAMPMRDGYYSTRLSKYKPVKDSSTHTIRSNNKLSHIPHHVTIYANGTRSTMNKSHFMISFQKGMLNNFAVTNDSSPDKQ